MITRDLRNYLIYTADLTGAAATPFESPQVFAGLTVNNRNDARRYLRDRVGERIFNSRRPQSTDSHHTAVTLQQIASTRELALVGEDPFAESVVDVTVWTKGPDADHRAEVAGRLIGLAATGFSGTWGDSSISCVRMEREAMEVSPPSGPDDWSFAWSFDLRIVHGVPAAVYPIERLWPRLTVAQRSTGIAVSLGATIVPSGRTIALVAVLAQNSSTGQIKYWQGHPDAAVAREGVTGINRDAVISGFSFPISFTFVVRDSASVEVSRTVTVTTGGTYG